MPLSSLDVPWANGLANLVSFLGAGFAVYAYLRLVWPQVRNVIVKRMPRRKRLVRTTLLRELHEIRCFDHYPRHFASRIGQQVSLLAIIAGGLFTYRAMAAPAAIRALVRHAPNRDVIIDMAVMGLLDLVMGTALILVAADAATRVRVWADPRSARLRVIRRYLSHRRNDPRPPQ